MPNKIIVILLYDTRVNPRSISNLLKNPDIRKLTQNFEIARLEGYFGALMLWPIGHYVIGSERVLAIKRFEQNNTIIHI